MTTKWLKNLNAFNSHLGEDDKPGNYCESLQNVKVKSRSLFTKTVKFGVEIFSKMILISSRF